MKTKILAFFLTLGTYAVFNNINAQELLIRIDKPFISNKLSGIIRDANNQPIPGVLVKRLTKDWNKEISFVETGSEGKFSFKDLPPRIYYLRLSAAGFNELEVIVKIKKGMKAKLVFNLEIST